VRFARTGRNPHALSASSNAVRIFWGMPRKWRCWSRNFVTTRSDIAAAFPHVPSPILMDFRLIGRDFLLARIAWAK